jgi:hypothetical protein
MRTGGSAASTRRRFANVFAFVCAADFLIAGKRPILTLSTRLLLVVVLGVAFGYVLSEHSLWHPVIGVGALILNVIFIGFALIDYVNWHKARTQR